MTDMVIRNLALLLVLFGSCFMAAALAQETTTKSGAGAPGADWIVARPVSSTIVLQIDTEQNGVRFIDAQVAAAVCASTAVVDPALTAALKLEPTKARSMVVVSAKPAGDGFVALEVQVTDPRRELPADAGAKVVEEVARRAAATLVASAEARLKPLRERRESLQTRLVSEEEKLAAIEAELAAVEPSPAMNARAQFDPTNFPAAELARQRSATALNLVELKARAKALEQQSAEAPQPATQPSLREADGSAVDLARRLADTRHKALQAAIESANAGQKTAENLDDIQSRWFEAELLVRLLGLEQRPMIGNGINDGRSTLAGLRIEIAAQQAKLDELDRQLGVLPAPAAPATQPAVARVNPAVIQDRLNQQRQRVEKTRTEIDNFDRQYGTLRTPAFLPLTAGKAAQ